MIALAAGWPYAPRAAQHPKREPSLTDLYDADGPATNTLAHLRALMADDPKARDKAIDHLSSANMHPPWTATGRRPSDERIDGIETERAELL